jgi:prepilin-type N-terminal cleavage/methylation domain-containing protein
MKSARDLQRFRGAGFTLIELAVSLAMAGIIALVAVGAGMQVNRALVETRRRAVVWDEAKRLEEALLSTVREAGGDPMAAWQSVIVEDNCAANGDRNLPSCNGADRLTVLSAEPARPACTVQVTGATLVGSPSSPCCLDGFSGSTTAAAVLVTEDKRVFTLTLTSLDRPNCRVNIQPGQGNPTPSTVGTGSRGQVALMRPVTIFPRQKTDSSEYELLRWTDLGTPATPANGVADEGEVQLVADRVYDFQIALGYDGNPENGDVLDNGTNADELFGNAEAIPATLPTPFVADQLRTIDIAIAVGAPADRFTGKAFRLHNRASALAPAGVYVAVTRGQVAFRNLNVSLP